MDRGFTGNGRCNRGDGERKMNEFHPDQFQNELDRQFQPAEPKCDDGGLAEALLLRAILDPDAPGDIVVPSSYRPPTTAPAEFVGLCHCRKCLECEKSRREELEVVAAALYLGHDDAKEQFDMYKAVYLDRPAVAWMRGTDE